MLQHCIAMSLELERCAIAKDDIVRYYEDIRKQIREGDELYMVQSNQLKNKAECCKQQAPQGTEARKEDALLADKTEIELKQMVEEAEAKVSALQQENAVLNDDIRRKMAEKEILRSRTMQALRRASDNVKKAQQKNEELTAKEEMLKGLIAKAETSLQEKDKDIDLLKNMILFVQEAICEARKRKQALSEEVGQLKAKLAVEEVVSHKLNSVLEKGNAKRELTSQPEQYKCEVKDKSEAISELQDSYRMKQEDVETLQEELQAEQLQQETVASEYKSKITDVLAELESKKKKSCDIDSELQREEQTAGELLERIQDVRGLNVSLLLESLSQEIPDSPEDVLKDMPAGKLFKSESKPIGKTGSQTKCFLHKE